MQNASRAPGASIPFRMHSPTDTSPGPDLKPLMLSRVSLLEFVVSHHWLCHKESNDDDEPRHVFNLQKILGVESRGYTLLRDSKVSEKRLRHSWHINLVRSQVK